MANKLQRNFQLIIQANSDAAQYITVQPPFTIEFDITRDTHASSNIASIRIYNLSEKNRNKILKDPSDYNSFRLVTLQVGYGNNLSTILVGNITQCWSVREGNNFITQIQSFDGGFAAVNGRADIEFPAGTSRQVVIETLAKSLTQYNLKPGAIGKFDGTIDRGNSYSGNTMDKLKELTNDGVFVDNGVIHCLNNTEAIDGKIFTVSAATGLLGTPMRESQFLNFDMLLEPSLKLGYQINLQSSTSKYSGNYKVIALKHKGAISGAASGEAITSVGVAPGQFSTLFQQVGF